MLSYKQQAENIASLGKFLFKNYKNTTITKEVEEKILKDWNVSSKVFERVFYEYKSTVRRIGVGHPEFSQKGSENSRARKIKNIDTGEIFGCIRDAAKSIKMNKKTLSGNLNRATNKTPMRYE